MNCDDFEERLQRLIDERAALADDDLLTAHASWCDPCQEQMRVWQQIESVVSDERDTSGKDAATANPMLPVNGPPISPLRSHVALAIFASVAAVVLVAFVGGYANQDNNLTVADNNAPVAAQQEIDVDPARWWRDVQDRDWLGETMPAVNSVRDGVAPLGRSIKQALAILTTGSGEKAS